MMQADALITLLPVAPENNPAAWLLAGETISWSGKLSDAENQLDAQQLADIPVTAIVPATHSTFRKIIRQGLEPKQELAVAKIRAQEAAIAPVQPATSFAENGRVNVATVDQAWLRNGLEVLEAMGLNVTMAVPAGALFNPPEGEIWRATLGNDGFLCSHDLCCPDDPVLASALLGSVAPKTIPAEDLNAALVAISRTPKPNFIDGSAIRRTSKPWLDDSHRKWAKRLALLALGLFVTSVLTHWVKLEWAISRENGAALAAAKSIDPAITDVTRAEAAVDAALARRGIERSKPSMLLAILWQSVKASENVALTNVSLDGTGLLTATLSAPDANSANVALIAIQRAGYQITATPRRDQSGATLVDLTMRAP